MNIFFAWDPYTGQLICLCREAISATLDTIYTVVYTLVTTDTFFG